VSGPLGGEEGIASARVSNKTVGTVSTIGCEKGEKCSNGHE
jgi:hypothetical protein